jgi:hypothetical protein
MSVEYVYRQSLFHDNRAFFVAISTSDANTDIAGPVSSSRICSRNTSLISRDMEEVGRDMATMNENENVGRLPAAPRR